VVGTDVDVVVDDDVVVVVDDVVVVVVGTDVDVVVVDDELVVVVGRRRVVVTDRRVVEVADAVAGRTVVVVVGRTVVVVVVVGRTVVVVELVEVTSGGAAGCETSARLNERTSPSTSMAFTWVVCRPGGRSLGNSKVSLNVPSLATRTSPRRRGVENTHATARLFGRNPLPTTDIWCAGFTTSAPSVLTGTG